MDNVRAAFSAGKASFGCWVSLSDTVAAEVTGKAGYDWAILDTQHGAIGWGALVSVIQALELGGTPALVRVGWSDQVQIMRALDLGALGVIVPMVSNAEQAKTAAQASRYPPEGIRSFGPVRNYYRASGDEFRQPLCIVMIETAEAMENIDAIAATHGVDGLFVGPMDLALALGYGAALTMPEEILEAIDRVVDAGRRHGVIVGSAALSLSNAKALMERGVQFLAVGSDAAHIRRGATMDVEEVRGWKQARDSEE